MAQPQNGRHLAAIMFIDMVDYSARMHEDELRTIDAVRELWDLVRPLLAAHGGREVDLAGDGMLTEFPGALAAVRCAQQIHAALHEQARGVRIRAGVHLGDIEHRDGQLYGDGVNIAARVIALAPAGAIAMTSHVRDQLVSVLGEPLQRLGLRALKNIKSPLELWCWTGPDCTAAELARAQRNDDTAARRWSFANIRLDERTLELSVGGAPLSLDRKSLAVLIHLLHHAGEVVTKEEVIEAAWPGEGADEASLGSCIARLQSALAGAGEEVIKTVHGFGYRLAVPVRIETTAAPLAPQLEFKQGDKVPSRPLWSLIECLGQGGHGEVWLARHDKTKEERVYKFAREAAHLASLKREITLSRVLHENPKNHDFFVRVLDWNLDEVPYFIECEYSKGGSLVEWAAAQGGLERVPLNTRIDLAAQIAEALAAAHVVGVLHKDVKPRNVLVEQPAGEPPRIKLADFGSGGVLDLQRLEALGITRLGFTKTRLDTSPTTSGTPMYLAPEVIAGQPFTAKSDMYALGVLLLQLVTGDLRRSLAPGWESGIDNEFLREDIAEAADGDPSRRLADPAALAARLRTLRERRAHRVAKRALREQAARQQRTIEDLRARRLWMLTAVTTLALGLVASLALTLYAYQVQTESAAVSRFLREKAFSLGNPLEGRVKDITLKDLLDRAAAAVDAELRGQPKAAAEVRLALAESYRWLGRMEEAHELLKRVRQDVERSEGPQSDLALLALSQLAQAQNELGRMADYRDSFDELKRRLKRQWLPDRKALLQVRLNVVDMTQNNDPESVLPELEEILRLASAANDDPKLVAQTRTVMAAVLEDLGRYARAEEVQRTLLADLVKRVGEQHFLTYQAQHTLSRLVAAQGRYAEAEGLLLPAVQNMESWLGREHHEAILSGAWIGALRREQGRFPEAEAIFRDVLRRCELQATCASSPNTVGSLRSQVADVCFLQRRLPEALKIYRQTVAMSQGGDANSRGAIYMRVRLAEVLAETGSFQEAAGIMQAIPPSFAHTEYRLGVWVGRLRRVEGLLALQSRDYAKAHAALAAALQIQEFRHGRDHWRTQRAREDLARVPAV